MNIIIYGGGFDPIHVGHLNIARLASKQFDGDVIFVPSHFPIWKVESAPIENKLEMIRLAIEEEPRFYIDEFELHTGKSFNYSIDTVKYFKKKYPNDTLFYLVGADQVNRFHEWKSPEELSSLAHIIYLPRPGFEINNDNVEKYHITKIEGEAIDISSTDIKTLHKITVPDNVLAYIEENGLYFIQEVKKHISSRRFTHSLSVAHLAYYLAKRHNFDNPEKAYIAGLLHDIGKDADKKHELMKKYFPEYYDLPEFSYHQFLGAQLAKDLFKIEDAEILDAIKFHATGNSGMSDLGKLIYACDKIEPTRGFDSSKLIMAMEKDLEKGFVKVLYENKIFLEKNRGNIDNRLTHECFECYLNK